MARHNILGRSGEDLAALYFKEKGYEILYTNWRHLHLEIDIIARHNYKLHFIEVKTRTNKKFGEPDDGVSKKKMKNLIDAAEEFLNTEPSDLQIQFDILSILLTKSAPAVYFYIEDVYINNVSNL
ncbi:YraN family protein [soil metagenome]